MLKETTGKTIKYLREKNDLTREDLCQMIRLGGKNRAEDVQRLYKVEDDKTELDDSIIETLAQLFDVGVDDIKQKEEWITAKEAAEIAGCSTQTIYTKNRGGSVKRKRIDGLYHYKKTDINNLEINKTMQSNGKSAFKKSNDDKIKGHDYYSSSDIAKKINVSFGYASASLSQFKKENEDKVISKKSETGGYMNALLKKYYNHFIEFMPSKYNKFKEKINEDKKLNFGIEKQQELISKHQKSMILELRETIKSQSAKIKELNNKVKELEKYYDKAEMKFEFFSDRITDLENLVDVLNENINKNVEVEKEKSFFGKLFS